MRWPTLLLGILASYALSPVVDWLKACHVPRPAGAALVLAVLVGGLSWVAFSVSGDATAMIEKLPEAARELRRNLSVARTSGPTALQNMQAAANELQGAAAYAEAKPGARVVTARATEPTTWLRDYALAQSALLATVVAQTQIVLLLTYFPAGVGRSLPPQAGGVHRAVAIAQEGITKRGRKTCFSFDRGSAWDRIPAFRIQLCRLPAGGLV